jgi:hypothetical protein
MTPASLTLRLARCLLLSLGCGLASHGQDAPILYNRTGSSLFLYHVDGNRSLDRVRVTFCDLEGAPVPGRDPVTLDLAGHLNCFDLPEECGARFEHVATAGGDLLLRLQVEAHPGPGNPFRSATVAFRSVQAVAGPRTSKVSPEPGKAASGIRWDAGRPGALVMLPVEGAAQAAPASPVAPESVVRLLMAGMRRPLTPPPAPPRLDPAPAPLSEDEDKAEAEAFGAALLVTGLCTIQ